MEIVGLLTGVPRRDKVVSAISRVAGGRDKKEWDGVSIPIICGNNMGMDDVQIACREKGIPYLYIDHGYFHRTPQMEWFRLCVSAPHCNDWRDSERRAECKVRNWKQPGNDIIIIHPTEKNTKVLKAEHWLDETVETLKLYTDRKIHVKHKGVGALNDILTKAFCAVTFSSVADCDAVLLGVPVFCGDYSPAYPVGLHDLSQIETPSTPDREQWLRSLSSSEWNLDEANLAWERIRCLLTVPMQDCKPQ